MPNVFYLLSWRFFFYADKGDEWIHIHCRKTIFVFIFLTFSTAPVSAQQINQPNPNHNLWISLNIGPAFHSSGPIIYSDVSLDYSNEKSMYSLQYFDIFRIPFSEPESASDKFSSFTGLNLLYGRIIRDSAVKFSYSAGLSLLFLTKEFHGDTITNEKQRALGFPVSVQFVLTPIHLIGIGIKANANLNSGNSYFGGSIGLYFGKVK